MVDGPDRILVAHPSPKAAPKANPCHLQPFVPGRQELAQESQSSVSSRAKMGCKDWDGGGDRQRGTHSPASPNSMTHSTHVEPGEHRMAGSVQHKHVSPEREKGEAGCTKQLQVQPFPGLLFPY